MRERKGSFRKAKKLRNLVFQRSTSGYEFSYRVNFHVQENTLEQFNILQVRKRADEDCKSFQYICLNVRVLYQIFFYIDRVSHQFFQFKIKRNNLIKEKYSSNVFTFIEYILLDNFPFLFCYRCTKIIIYVLKNKIMNVIIRGTYLLLYKKNIDFIHEMRTCGFIFQI